MYVYTNLFHVMQSAENHLQEGANILSVIFLEKT